MESAIDYNIVFELCAQTIDNNDDDDNDDDDVGADDDNDLNGNNH